MNCKRVGTIDTILGYQRPTSRGWCMCIQRGRIPLWSLDQKYQHCLGELGTAIFAVYTRATESESLGVTILLLCVLEDSL